MLLCREVMKTQVFTCKENDTVAQCAALMRRHNIGFVPVIDDRGRFVGAVTDRDLAIRVLADSRPSNIPIGEVMTREQVTCRTDDRLDDAEARMAEAQKSRLVCVDEGNHVIGVISLSDIARVDKPKHAGRLLESIAAREAPPSIH